MNAQEQIIQKIKEHGKISFHDFMQIALYGDNGYYSSGRASIGKKGDFYTAPHVSDAFGKTICQCIKKLCGEKTTLVTMGAGMGFLEKDILDHAKTIGIKIDLIIVEPFSHFEEKQKENLQGFDIKWVKSIMELNGINGVFLSNELFDALPTHRIKDVDDLKEVFVTHDGSFKEVYDTPTPEVSEFIKNHPQDIVKDQEKEIPTQVVGLMNNIIGAFDQGYFITIDYGGTTKELARMFSGSLMRYKDGKSSENLYEDVGESDLTSHVNFELLEEIGKKYSLETIFYGPQRKFLIENGILDLTKTQEDALKLQHLIHPTRMGERFKVLIQKKGL